MYLISSQPRWRVLGAVCLALAISWLLYSSSLNNTHQQNRSSFWTSRRGTEYANSTLGFQEIIAISSEDVSHPQAWRRTGLVAAANRTGLLLSIEQTSDVQANEVNRIMTAGTGVHPSRGQAQAWAAHERLLRKVIERKITSALILEDDVDWELSIRQLLKPSGKIASAVRRLSGSDDELDASLWPYGDTFDVVWLGHCGMRSQNVFLDSTHFNISFVDDLVLPTSQLKVWDHGPFEGPPDGYRQVRLGSEVVCSFGYGITWQGAIRLLERLKGGGTAFDVELDNACSYGTLRCLVVNPEVMHAQDMIGGAGSLIAAANNVGSGSARPLEEGNEAEEAKPITPNIRYSARCNAQNRKDQLIQCLPSPEDLWHVM